MTDLRPDPWAELRAGINAGQHLALDAVVAFVDGELSPSARERAAAHIAGCSMCAAEVTAQRQTRSAVRSADSPCTPAGLLAALQAIPQRAELPGPPDRLPGTCEGRLVAPAPDGSPPAGTGRLGNAAGFGTSPMGSGAAVLGNAARRTRQSASVVVSGLVLGALVFSVPAGSAVDPADEVRPASAEPARTRPVPTPVAPPLQLRLERPAAEVSAVLDAGSRPTPMRGPR